MNTNPSASVFADDESRWIAVTTRDRAADGSFFYSVKTTGVYCRPSCASRAAKRENVAFHGTAQEAEARGFRPCKRCAPNQPGLPQRHAALVAQLCRLIDDADTAPTLEDLATRAGVSMYHLHRIFRAVTGLTPKRYAMERRRARLREQLAQAESVTEAFYEGGYGSSGHFYAEADEALGMRPAAFRVQGANTDIRFAAGQCSLGAIVVAASERGVCAILLGDDAESLIRDLQDRFPRARLIGADEDFERVVAAVVGFVEAPRLGLDLPLDLRGTAFQRRVWQALRAIPVGQTATYSAIAKEIGSPAAVRAVAGACAANALAVAIPCHRVVRSDGSLSGYRWGIDRKRALLLKERQGDPD